MYVYAFISINKEKEKTTKNLSHMFQKKNHQLIQVWLSKDSNPNSVAYGVLRIVLNFDCYSYLELVFNNKRSKATESLFWFDDIIQIYQDKRQSQYGFTQFTQSAKIFPQQERRMKNEKSFEQINEREKNETKQNDFYD